MAQATQAKTIRRSFALSSKLIDEALLVNDVKEISLNRLVTIALQEYVNNRKRREFEKSMLAMGNDPEVLRECEAINKDFSHTEADGLSSNK